jgi:hypothetical protein
MSKDELTGPDAAVLPVLGLSESTATARTRGGRWAVATYASAWRRACDALWREELADPLFQRAVALAIEDDPTIVDSVWPYSERWRDYIRSWWLAARVHYRGPDDIPIDWIMEQRGRDADGLQGDIVCRQPEREFALAEPEAAKAHRATLEAKWERLKALIGTGDFWPLHLDAEQILRAQLETMGDWAVAFAAKGACAS